MLDVQLYDHLEDKPLDRKCNHSTIRGRSSSDGYSVISCDKPARAVGRFERHGHEIHRCDKHMVDLIDWIEKCHVRDVEMAVEDGHRKD